MIAAGERLYLSDDAELGVTANPDVAVRGRHIMRYARAIGLAGRTGGTWLDFACGSGYGTEMIAEVAELAVGMDRDPVAIHYAVKHHDHPRCVYRVATADKVWDIMGRHLKPDVVVCIETFEHLDIHAQAWYLHAVAGGLPPDGTFILACPIGKGHQSANPWHLHEPTLLELDTLLGFYFNEFTLETEQYESTSGPAIQAWAVCR